MDAKRASQACKAYKQYGKTSREQRASERRNGYSYRGGIERGTRAEDTCKRDRRIKRHLVAQKGPATSKSLPDLERGALTGVKLPHVFPQYTRGKHRGQAQKGS